MREVDANFRTHLTVNFFGKVERDQVKDYDRESAPAGNKVDLWEGQIGTEEIRSNAMRSSRTHTAHR